MAFASYSIRCDDVDASLDLYRMGTLMRRFPTEEYELVRVVACGVVSCVTRQNPG